jgi:hypothetical protein
MASSQNLQEYLESLYGKKLSQEEMKECGENLFCFLDLLIEIDLKLK